MVKAGILQEALIAGEMLTLYAQLPDEAQKKRLSSLPVDPFAMDFIV
jgi:hypothetical protein